MAITTQTIVTGSCDLCAGTIDTDHSYVDAMAYGATFHLECVTDSNLYTPFDILKALDLDDIYMTVKGESSRKLIYNFT